MADRAITFKGADSKGVVSSIVDGFGSPMNLTIEARFKYQEDGNGAFRKIVWWGNESPLTTKGFCLGISPEGHLQFEAFDSAALPSVPTLMGVMPTTGGFSQGEGAVRKVRVHGNYAFVTSGTGLTVVDVSNETVLTMVGASNVIMICQNLALSLDGTKAVLTGSRQYYDGAGVLVPPVSCLYVVDVSVPTSPKLIGVLETTELDFAGLVLSGNYAYVASGTAGLTVVNLSNPASPVVDNTYNISGGNANRVAVVGNYAYVADRNLGLVIVNISNPAAPTLVIAYATHSAPYQAVDVFVSGALAYVGGNSTVQIVDVSTPTAPVTRGVIPPSGNEVLVANNVAYVASSSGLSKWDVSNPASPTQIGSTLTPTGGPSATTLGLCLDPQDSSLVYCANGSAGLALVRTTPVLTQQLSNVAEWFNASNVAVRGDLMIVSGTHFRKGGQSPSFGLRLFNDRTAPRLVGQFDSSVFSCGGKAISSDGLYLFAIYISASLKGVKVFDISNLAAPTVVRTVNLAGFPNGIALSGNYLYVACAQSGLKVVDVTTPTAAVEVGAGYDTPNNAWNVLVVGTKAYVSDSTSLQILDVTNPAAIGFLGVYTTSCLDVAVNGNTAYLAASISGVKIVDVTDPEAVTLLGTLPLPTGINPSSGSVAVAGTRVCFTNAASGLSVWDATDPAVPVRVGTGDFLVTGIAREVIMDDGWAYVAPSAGTINSFYLGS